MSLFINYRFVGLTILAAIGRLQVVMAPAALLVAGNAAGLGASKSSVIAGSVLFAGAFSAAFKGRIIDQKGYSFITIQAIFLAVAFTLTIISFQFLSWEFALLGAILIGLARINSGPLQNSLWARYHQKETLLQKTLALENTIGFLMQIIAPLIIGFCLLFAGGMTALIITAVIASLSMFGWGLLAPKHPVKTTQQKQSIQLQGIKKLVVFILFTSAAAGLLQGILLNTSGSRGAFMLTVFTLGAAGLSGFFLTKGFRSITMRRLAPVIAPLAFIPALLLLETAFVWPFLLIAGMAFAASILSINTQVKEMISKNRLTEGFSLTLTANITGSGLGILISGFLVAGMWQLLTVVILVAFVLINLILEKDKRLENPYLLKTATPGLGN